MVEELALTYSRTSHTGGTITEGFQPGIREVVRYEISKGGQPVTTKLMSSDGKPSGVTCTMKPDGQIFTFSLDSSGTNRLETANASDKLEIIGDRDKPSSRQNIASIGKGDQHVADVVDRDIAPEVRQFINSGNRSIALSTGQEIPLVNSDPAFSAYKGTLGKLGITCHEPNGSEISDYLPVVRATNLVDLANQAVGTPTR